MPCRRRPASPSSSYDTERDSPGPNRKRRRLRSNTPLGSQSEDDASAEEPRPLKVYIVQAKLDTDATTELYNIIEGFALRASDSNERTLQLQLCSEVEDADVVVTAVRMRRRFERHVEWKTAKQKAIVTPNWLRDSKRAGRPLPCGEYAALPELEEETAKNCPDQECSGCDMPHSPSGNPGSPPTNRNDPPFAVRLSLGFAPTVRPTDTAVFNNWGSKYAVQRASPLVCPNQGLVNELSILCRNRELEGLSQNALAYERAIGIIKSYPRVITSDTFKSDLAKFPGLGAKTQIKILEYVDQGYVNEARATLASERYHCLSLFTSKYGIGPTKARQFYDMGMRTIVDLERYYDIPPNPDSKNRRPPEVVTDVLKGLEVASGFKPNGEPIGDEGRASELSIPVGIVLKDELDVRIPRAEVEEIRDIVLNELEELQPGCVSTIVGGYRRGKLMSNDVDIVISHSNYTKGKDIMPGLCKRLTAQLYRKGLVTHVMHLSGFHAHNALREEHWDSLEKALTVFKLPPSKNNPVRIHRRVDIIFALPESYWTAVIGWSGSKMFQRDLRLWAKQEKGMKFDSVGLTRRHDSKRFLPKTEEEVFQILGLPWIDPTMRNVDA